MFSDAQMRLIFERIGLLYKPDTIRDAALLAKIQHAFLTTVPYENLDILAGIPLSFEPEALYDKIVTRRRGGYCFELNGFLAFVLRDLGYPVKEYMGRFLQGETAIPMRRHRILGVEAEGKRFICDIGVGRASFRIPLEMREGYVSEQYGERYVVDKEPFFGWVVSDFHKGEWRRLYSFTEEEQLNIDYIMPSFWCEHAPESPFIAAPKLSIKTDTGRITLDGSTFRIFDGDKVEERVLNGDELREVCKIYFGLDYNEKSVR